MTKQTKTYIALLTGLILFSCLIFYGTKATEDDSDNNESEFKTLVWSDEFNGTGTISSDNWFHQTQLPPGGNWWGGLI